MRSVASQYRSGIYERMCSGGTGCFLSTLSTVATARSGASWSCWTLQECMIPAWRYGAEVIAMVAKATDVKTALITERQIRSCRGRVDVTAEALN